MFSIQLTVSPAANKSLKIPKLLDLFKIDFCFDKKTKN